MQEALDPVKDLKLTEVHAVESATERALALSDCLAEMGVLHLTCSADRVASVLEERSGQESLRRRVQTLRWELSDDRLHHMPDFNQRVAVLEQLGYVHPETGMVQLKGRVALEMNSADELLMTEFLLGGGLGPLSPEEAAALLSVFVFQERVADPGPPPTGALADACDMLWDLAGWLGGLQADKGLPTNANEYTKGCLNFGLLEVVYAWAMGTKFAEVMTLTAVPEGTIVRCILRLDETCREVRAAAEAMGNEDLAEKMRDAALAIKRDVVFAASLYVE